MRSRQIVGMVIMIVAAVFIGTIPVVSFATQQEEPAPQVATAEQPSAGKININTADAAQLEALPGIGPRIAQDILEYREAHGPFGSIDNIKDVKGIGDKKFEAIKDMISTE